MIELKNMTKTFNTADGVITALKDINLTVHDGEIFGVIGLSGAGKSTLVRCINLLERPDCGEVLIDGRNLMTMDRHELLLTRRGIGMIFQNYNLLEQRNVLKNVCFPLEIAGVPRKSAEQTAMELLGTVGLVDRAKAYPSQLSGGMKQRVAIARALATKPKYLLCDEATSALDPNTTDSILTLLRDINRNMGVTLVVITHQMNVIDRICDRVAVIDKSEIAEIGSVSEVFANPKSEISRELILPSAPAVHAVTDGLKLRIVFNGGSSYQPVLANMILECQITANILFADTKNIEGRAYGQMLIQIPDDERQIARAKTWLNINKIDFTEEK